MPELNYPLTEPQLELLKMFSNSSLQGDWENIRRIILTYLAEKLEKEAKKIAEEKQYSKETFNDFLNEHLRTPYKHS